MIRNIDIVDIFSLAKINIVWNVCCEIPILDPSLLTCPENIIWFRTSTYYKLLEIRHWVWRCFIGFGPIVVQKMSAFMSYISQNQLNFWGVFLTKDWSNTKEIFQVSILIEIVFILPLCNLPKIRGFSCTVSYSY